MTPDEAVAEVRRILRGIDADQSDYTAEGWWETSTGVEFGIARLAEVEALVRSLATQQNADAPLSAASDVPAAGE